jgi:hypothetical protein
MAVSPFLPGQRSSSIPDHPLILGAGVLHLVYEFAGVTTSVGPWCLDQKAPDARAWHWGIPFLVVFRMMTLSGSVDEGIDSLS